MRLNGSGQLYGFQLLEHRQLLSINTWIGGDGNWADDAHWSAGHVPLATEDAVVGPAVNIIFDSGDEAVHTITTDASDSLSISGGSLTIGADSTVSGVLNLSGGALTTDGTLTLAGVSNQWAGATVSGTYTGSGGGTIALASGTLDIDAGGAVFDFPDGMFQWTGGDIGGGVLDNTGVIALGGDTQKNLDPAQLSTTAARSLTRGATSGESPAP